MKKTNYTVLSKNNFQLFKVLFIAILIFNGNTLFSQNVSKKIPQLADTVRSAYSINPNAIDVDKTSLRRATLYRDYPTAISIVHNLLSKNPTNQMWGDSLCSLYYLNNSYEQAILVANDLLRGKYDNYKIANILAIAYQKKGDLKEALNVYEKMYELFRDPYHLYDVAQLQYFLKRNAEFNLTVNKLLQLPEEKLKGLSLEINSKKARQSVPFKAAVHNLNGVMLMDSGKKEEAIKCFQAALAIFPEYHVAKANLESLQKKK